MKNNGKMRIIDLRKMFPEARFDIYGSDGLSIHREPSWHEEVKSWYRSVYFFCYEEEEWENEVVTIHLANYC